MKPLLPPDIWYKLISPQLNSETFILIDKLLEENYFSDIKINLFIDKLQISYNVNYPGGYNSCLILSIRVDPDNNYKIEGIFIHSRSWVPGQRDSTIVLLSELDYL